MSTPIRRRRATDDITGMAPPVDPVSAFKKSGKDKRDSFEGENEYANSVNRSVGETQRNVRHLKDLIDSLVLRIAELEKINEPFPSIPYVPKLLEGTDIRIDTVGRDKRISSLVARAVAKADALPTSKYSVTTTEENPGTNNFRLNHATIASSTKMYINDSLLNGMDLSALLTDVSEDSHLYLQNVGKATEALSLKVVEVTDNTGWFTIEYTVDAIATETTWTDLATFGFLFPLSAGGVLYDGPFAITDNGNDTLNISAGKVINGTTVSSIAAATNESVSGKTYLSIEIWYNASWKSDYLAGAAYPTQAVKTDGGTDYPCFRRLIAEKVGGVWKQRFNDSEIVNPRVAD